MSLNDGASKICNLTLNYYSFNWTMKLSNNLDKSFIQDLRSSYPDFKEEKQPNKESCVKLHCLWLVWQHFRFDPAKGLFRDLSAW